MMVDKCKANTNKTVLGVSQANTNKTCAKIKLSNLIHLFAERLIKFI